MAAPRSTSRRDSSVQRLRRTGQRARIIAFLARPAYMPAQLTLPYDGLRRVIAPLPPSKLHRPPASVRHLGDRPRAIL